VILTVILTGNLIAWLVTARRFWRLHRPGGVDQLVDNRGTPDSPSFVLFIAMLSGLVWPLFILKFLATVHQPMTDTELKNRAEARQHEIEEAEHALDRVNELLNRIVAEKNAPMVPAIKNDLPECVSKWIGTAYEAAALELYNKFGLVVITEHSKWNTEQQWIDNQFGDDPT
jgi:hypothetical protein